MWSSIYIQNSGSRQFIQGVYNNINGYGDCYTLVSYLQNNTLANSLNLGIRPQPSAPVCTVLTSTVNQVQTSFIHVRIFFTNTADRDFVFQYFAGTALGSWPTTNQPQNGTTSPWSKLYDALNLNNANPSSVCGVLSVYYQSVDLANNYIQPNSVQSIYGFTSAFTSPWAYSVFNNYGASITTSQSPIYASPPAGLASLNNARAAGSISDISNIPTTSAGAALNSTFIPNGPPGYNNGGVTSVYFWAYSYNSNPFYLIAPTTADVGYYLPSTGAWVTAAYNGYTGSVFPTIAPSASFAGAQYPYFPGVNSASSSPPPPGSVPPPPLQSSLTKFLSALPQ